MHFRGSGRLTVVNVKALMTQGIKGRHGDGGGLHLYIDEGRNARWVLRWTIRGKRRDIGIGPAWDVGLAEARKRAAKYREQVRDGLDPIAERKKARVASEVPTFEQMAREVWKGRAEPAKGKATLTNAKFAREWIRSLEQHAFPILGQKRVDEIDRTDVRRVLEPIWNEKPASAKMLKQRLVLILDTAFAKGYRRDENPAEHVEKALPPQDRGDKHHAALPYAAVPEFVAKLRKADAYEGTRLGLEFIILTASRFNEAASARWDEFEGDLWTVPAERMKRRKPHTVPLCARAMEIVERAREIGCGSPYVFPASRGGGPFSSTGALVLVKAVSGNGATIHGFRSAFRDWAGNAADVEREIAEQCLAHHIGSAVEQAYRRDQYVEKRRVVMDRWAAFIEGQPEADNVVPMERASAG